MLTSDECARIVHASIDPSRILAGIDGYNGSPPDVLLTVVAKIKADAVTAARAEVLAKVRELPPLMAVAWGGDQSWLTTGTKVADLVADWLGADLDDALVADLGGDHA